MMPLLRSAIAVAFVVLGGACFEPTRIPQNKAVNAGSSSEFAAGEYLWSDASGRLERRTRRGGVELVVRALSPTELARFTLLLDPARQYGGQLPPAQAWLIRALNAGGAVKALSLSRVEMIIGDQRTLPLSLSEYAEQFYSPALLPYLPSAAIGPRRNGFFFQFLPDWLREKEPDTRSVAELRIEQQQKLARLQQRFAGWELAAPGDEVRVLHLFVIDQRCSPCRLHLPGAEGWFLPLEYNEFNRLEYKPDEATLSRLEQDSEKLDQSFERQYRTLRSDRLDLFQMHRQRQEHYRMRHTEEPAGQPWFRQL